MKILLTNDDGPSSAGLCALRDALDELGEVLVVCPAQERSGVAHAITYLDVLRAGWARLADGRRVRTVSGTPADCVKFALLEDCDGRPDLIVSGPNRGVNAGVAAFYSGTVAAAIEGAISGIRSVAFSTALANDGREAEVGGHALRVLRMLLECAPAEPWAFSVNIPSLEGREPEVHFARQCTSVSAGRYTRPEGSADGEYRLDWVVDADSGVTGSDIAVLGRGDISVTPLVLNLTDLSVLSRMLDLRVGTP